MSVALPPAIRPKIRPRHVLEWADRVLIAALAIFDFFVALRLGHLHTSPAGGPAWTAAFALAAGTALALDFAPSRPRLAVSGLIGVGCYLARAAAVLAIVATEHHRPGLALAAALWLVLAALVAYVWVEVLRARIGP